MTDRGLRLRFRDYFRHVDPLVVFAARHDCTDARPPQTVYPPFASSVE